MLLLRRKRCLRLRSRLSRWNPLFTGAEFVGGILREAMLCVCESKGGTILLCWANRWPEKKHTVWPLERRVNRR
jgi:hypothetical protein